MRYLSLIALVAGVWASEPIGIDTLFGKEKGFKSTTSLMLVGSSDYQYSLYPNTSAQKVSEQSKSVSLQQMLLYTVDSSLEVFGVGVGSYRKTEKDGEDFTSSSKFSFDALWFGASYATPSILDFVPQITLQAALIERQSLEKDDKNFYLHSFSGDVRLQSFSDPVVYALYVGGSYNHKRNFKDSKLKVGDSLFAGMDISVLLSPKVSLDFELEQAYQAPSKLNGIKTSSSYLLPSLTVGATYSFNANTAIAISGSAAGSGAAPDSSFRISLWKKF